MNANRLDLHPLPDPTAETIRALAAWPDSALYRLARGLAGELNCRQLATPCALPVSEAAAAAIYGAPPRPAPFPRLFP
jgi:hypothetical protein